MVAKCWARARAAVGPTWRIDSPTRTRHNGRSFAASQTHWYRLADGRVIWHAANRDDLGQARQLGWVPPSPAFLVRSGLARRHLGRAGQSSSIVPPVRQ